MSDIKGGKGLHGPDKQQDALRDVRSGARAVRAKHLIQAKGSEPSTSARNGVQMYGRACQMPTRSIQRSRTCPRACLAREWAPWTRTLDEATSSARASAIPLGAVEQLPQGQTLLSARNQRPAPQVGCPSTKIWDIIEKVGVTMLTTQFPGGLRARPLEARPERDAGLIWFVTDVRSGKEHEIEAEHDVCLVFIDAAAKAYLSITARAEVRRDHAKAAEILEEH